MNIHELVLVRIDPRHHLLTFAPLRHGRIVWGQQVELRSPKARFLGSEDLGEPYTELL